MKGEGKGAAKKETFAVLFLLLRGRRQRLRQKKKLFVPRQTVRNYYPSSTETPLPLSFLLSSCLNLHSEMRIASQAAGPMVPLLPRRGTLPDKWRWKQGGQLLGKLLSLHPMQNSTVPSVLRPASPDDCLPLLPVLCCKAMVPLFKVVWGERESSEADFLTNRGKPDISV